MLAYNRGGSSTPTQYLRGRPSRDQDVTLPAAGRHARLSRFQPDTLPPAPSHMRANRFDALGRERVNGGQRSQHYVGNGYYTLVNKTSGHCLDVQGGSTNPGANVWQWICNSQSPQIWGFELRI